MTRSRRHNQKHINGDDDDDDDGVYYSTVAA